MKYYDRSKTEFGLPPEEFPLEKEYDAPVMEESFVRYPKEALEDNAPAPEITEPGGFKTRPGKKKEDSPSLRLMAYPYCAVALLTIFIGIGPLKNAFFGMNGNTAANKTGKESSSSSESSMDDEAPAETVKTDIGLRISSAVYDGDNDEVVYYYDFDMSKVSYPLSVYAKITDGDDSQAKPKADPDVWDGSRAGFPYSIDVSELDGDMTLALRIEFEKDGIKYYSTAEKGVSVSAGTTPTPTPTEIPDEGGEKADDAFPILSNLEPNGPAPLLDFENGGFARGADGEVIRAAYNEEYIRVNGNNDYLYAGTAYTSVGITATNVPGASYDLASNTLTLNNYTGDMLNVNLMGNGFTVELIGENRLDCLVVWGWMYGGSVKFTGNGSLTIANDDPGVNNGFGIFLNAEGSQSCIMVDSDVTLDVSGVEGALLVYGTTMEKAVYYLKPLALSEGTRMGSDPYSDPSVCPDNEDIYNYTIVDEDEMPVKHVRFAK